MKISEVFVALVTVCFIFELAEANLENCKASRIVNRIFGGVKVRKGKCRKTEVPWLVALYNRQYGRFFCAGSLISEKHILSGITQMFSQIYGQFPVAFSPFLTFTEPFI